jgi:sodium/potassium-transporting ATPase subunit alpha
MAGFKNFIPPETLVIRDGKQSKLPATELVPGDLVIIEFGKKIPADIRIVESNQMKVDNSSLTGESALQLRTPECSHPDNPLETKNLAFFGTLCKEVL